VWGDICDAGLVRRRWPAATPSPFAAESTSTVPFTTPAPSSAPTSSGPASCSGGPCAPRQPLPPGLHRRVWLDRRGLRETDRLCPSAPMPPRRRGVTWSRLLDHYRLPVLITRASSTFGSHQYPEKVIALHRNALDRPRSALRRRPPGRDWLYVPDHAAALDLVSKGTGASVQRRQRPRAAERRADAPDPRPPREAGEPDPPRDRPPGSTAATPWTRASCARSAGSRPRLRPALAATVAWYRARGWWRRSRAGVSDLLRAAYGLRWPAAVALEQCPLTNCAASRRKSSPPAVRRVPDGSRTRPAAPRPAPGLRRGVARRLLLWKATVTVRTLEERGDRGTPGPDPGSRPGAGATDDLGRRRLAFHPEDTRGVWP
jgi:hypothetical protein